MSLDQPADASACPMPWDVIAQQAPAADETIFEANRRSGVAVRRLSAMAKALVGFVARHSWAAPVPTLPPAQWDRIVAACVAARKQRGPKAGYMARQVGRGRECIRTASARTGLSLCTLMARARNAGVSYARGLTRRRWDRLAALHPRRASRCSARQTPAARAA